VDVTLGDVEMTRRTPPVSYLGETWNLILARRRPAAEGGHWWLLWMDGFYWIEYDHLLQNPRTQELRWVRDERCWFDDPPGKIRTWADVPEHTREMILASLYDDYAAEGNPVRIAVPLWRESRKLYGKPIQDHFGEGMRVRNWLRAYCTDEQLGGNWDDYYVDCVSEFLDRLELLRAIDAKRSEE
jgi:hypothetical protein